MKWQWSLRLIFSTWGSKPNEIESIPIQWTGKWRATKMLVPSKCQNLAWRSLGTKAFNLERAEPGELCHWKGEGLKNPIHFCKIQTRAQNPRQNDSGFFLTAGGKETPGAWPAARGCVIRAKLAVPSLAVAGSPTARPCCTFPAPSWDPFWRAAFPSVSLRSPVCYSASWLV